MTAERILVINPNSNAAVTRGLDTAVEPLRRISRLQIDCVTLDETPFGIESDDDIRMVAPFVARAVAANDAAYDAFVIACYSDPGLSECRDVSSKTVVGIQESAVRLSVAQERRFGVLALSEQSIQRHVAYVRGLGLHGFHAGERALNIDVDDAVNDPATRAKIIAAGRTLIEDDGAETLILGCAGMAAHRQPVQEGLGVPVIDPVMAAVTLVAEGA